jgi:hypothetical protein
MKAGTLWEDRRLNVFSLGNAVLAGIMVACFVTTVIRVIAVFDAAWFTGLLGMRREITIGAFLVALEVHLTRRLLEQHMILSWEWCKRILSEWGTILVGLLVLVWVRVGPAVTLADLPRLGEKTSQVLMRPEFLEALLLLIVIWGISRLLATDLIAAENIPSTTSREAMRGVIQEQNSARDQLWQMVFILGGVMVFLSVFSLPMLHFLNAAPMEFGSLGFEIIIYFLCGFGLFVISRLLILQSEWVMERTAADSSVTRHWLVYGLLFILLLLILSVVLPTAYTFQLLESLNVVVTGLSTLLSILWLMIVYPVIWLLSQIIPPLGSSMGELQDLPEEMGTQQNLPGLPQGLTWEAVAREILFWAIAGLLVIYILRQILERRGVLLRRLRRTALFRRILDFLFRLRKRWTVWRKSAARAIRESWEALRQDIGARGGGARGGFLNLRRLDPRQSIRFYFFALLRRGAERGVVRRPAQTPREYSTALAVEEDQIRAEIQELSLAFEESRYTAHPMSAEQARHIRRVWDTIRATLHSPQKKEKTPQKRNEKQAGGERSQ